MSATFNPFGLAPALHQSGIVRPAPTPGSSLRASQPNLFLNAPVSGLYRRLSESPTALGQSEQERRSIVSSVVAGAEFTLTATVAGQSRTSGPQAQLPHPSCCGNRDPCLRTRSRRMGPVLWRIWGTSFANYQRFCQREYHDGILYVAIDTATGAKPTGTSTSQLRIVGSPSVSIMPG